MEKKDKKERKKRKVLKKVIVAYLVSGLQRKLVNIIDI